MVQIQMPQTVRGDYSGHGVSRGVDAWLVEELHDGVAQSLWYLGVELSALDQEISPHEARLRQQVKTLGEVAQEAYHQVRSIIGQTWAEASGEGTLDGVVRREVRSFEERTGVEVGLNLGSVRLEAAPWQVHHLAAIVREALSNAWRHGRARTIQVDLEATEERISLSVADRGTGFNPTVARGGHYGMSTMRKRAHALGGDLEVLSKVGKGTRVNLTIPREAMGGWEPE